MIAFFAFWVSFGFVVQLLLEFWHWNLAKNGESFFTFYGRDWSTQPGWVISEALLWPVSVVIYALVAWNTR